MSGDTIEIKAEFDEALNLAEGAPVKVNGVDSGTVKSITIDDYTAIGTMDVRTDAQGPEGATARRQFAEGAAGYAIEYTTALAKTFWLCWKVLFTRGFDAIHACNPPDLFFLIGGLEALTVYNIMVLMGFAHAGYGTFVLARMVTRHVGGSCAEPLRALEPRVERAAGANHAVHGVELHPLGQRVVPITVRVGGRSYRYTFGNAAAAVGPSANIYMRNMIRARRSPSPASRASAPPARS